MSETNSNRFKESLEPAYSQVARALRGFIADGTYPPGSRLPSALAISDQFKVSPMTARQAIISLTEEGLLESHQGSGTYVKHLGLRDSGFSLKSLDDLITADNTKVRIMDIKINKASPDLAEKLNVASGHKVIQIVRLLLSDGFPVLLQSGHVLYDPCRPLVEAELDAVSLYGFLGGDKTGLIKKGSLEARPWMLLPKEAELLEQDPKTIAFLIEYLFYDFSDLPIGHGAFLIPHPFLTLKTDIGLWNT